LDRRSKSFVPPPVGVEEALIVASTLERAKQTAKIIAQVLNVDPIVFLRSLENDEFYDGTQFKPEIEALVTDGHRLLVTVGHFKAPSGFIHSVATTWGGFRCVELKKGQGIALCLETGQISIIPPDAPPS